MSLFYRELCTNANVLTIIVLPLNPSVSLKLSNIWTSSHRPEFQVLTLASFFGRKNGILYSNPWFHQLFRESEEV